MRDIRQSNGNQHFAIVFLMTQEEQHLHVYTISHVTNKC